MRCGSVKDCVSIVTYMVYMWENVGMFVVFSIIYYPCLCTFCTTLLWSGAQTINQGPGELVGVKILTPQEQHKQSRFSCKCIRGH